MLRGGYKLIDLKGVNLVPSADPVKVEGVYEAIESSNNKATIVCGFTLSGVEKPDVWVNFYSSGSDYKAVLAKSSEGSDLSITVTDQDMVSIA